MASKEQQPDLKQIATKLLQDLFDNVIHDLVINEHRKHKLMLAALDPQTKLPHCDNCKLPRLLDPPLAPKVRGATSDPPSDTQYCDRKPWSRIPGHDIYGNPFPKADATGRPPTKKEREAAKNAKKDGFEGTPASEETGQNGTGPPSPSENGEQPDRKLEKGEKKANKIDEKLKKGEYVPWHTCPQCKRSLLITRFAKHLEQCMGLSGRAASRNAMAKINGSTPMGSRSGTPGPSQDSASKTGAGDDDDDDDLAVKGPGGVRKKLLKKGLTTKLKKEKSLTPSANGKLPKGLAAKRPPGSGPRASPAPSSLAEKRYRDEMLLGEEGDEGEEIHVKKRQKLARVGSTTSVTSQLTAPTGSAAMERGESRDGSFVGDGSVVEE
ncbi:hypothetical protein BAUCODRAFT_35742 [Baudoinia panamericana UAMH 10762]|uniref:SAGA-associated factor 11 n=1 Tax=Baudoinia panamericana (strain UAMH 10762) TaxID=717646 RepID=M2MSQ3_BAUPA|nr:uncharacterized protein BAUCODRAFT_35742 [Baudoinia panamericana UAMH 10762]EMC94523.1 hypothetical protein BAUCODRAFT_35742 [Baudoinia panamericana UAMH 10762]